MAIKSLSGFTTKLFACVCCLRALCFQGGEAATLDQFRKQFDDVAFKKGTEIVFVQEGNKLVTKVDGQQVRGGAQHWLTQHKRCAHSCHALLGRYCSSQPACDMFWNRL